MCMQCVSTHRHRFPSTLRKSHTFHVDLSQSSSLSITILRTCLRTEFPSRRA